MSAASLVTSAGTIALAGSSPTVTSFTGHANGWNSVTGDNGDYSLDDAWLAVFGDLATVTFASVGDKVSFNGPSTAYYDETVNCVGGSGDVSVVHAHVTLSGEDNVIFFDPSDDVLNLASAANGWNTLYASSGAANLYGASLNILGVTSQTVVGNVITVNAVSGVNAVSLYQNEGNSYLINGDDVTVTLNNTTAALHGSGDQVWFVGGSASTAALDLTGSEYATVYGPGTVSLQGGTVISVGGGVLVDFVSAGGVADLSYTQGIWDRVTGAAGTIAFRHAQASVYGGGQTIDFVSGDDNAASLYQTNGNWDSVSGYASNLSINSAQANVYGNIDNIYLNGAGAEVSIYGNFSSSQMSIHADDEVAIVNNASVDVIGGGDSLYANPSGYGYFSISGTSGNWDKIYENNQYIFVSDAQASVFGGGDTIQANDASDAVSLYNTLSNADAVEGGGAVTLNSAAAVLYGAHFYLYFGSGPNSVDLSYISHDDLLTLVGAFGQDTITNFQSTDMIAVSKSQFADFTAFHSALTQVGDDAVLTLDANDKATFVGVQTSAITASQVTIV